MSALEPARRVAARANVGVEEHAWQSPQLTS